DDVFALDAKTGQILWEHWSQIGQTISTICCGWLNRGLAMGEGMLFIAQLDANMVALDIKTGKEVWRTPVEDWRKGYGMTAPRRSTSTGSSIPASPAASSAYAAA